MRDQYYRQKQLSEIIWKPGVSIQGLCDHVAVLFNKVYPLSSLKEKSVALKL